MEQTVSSATSTVTPTILFVSHNNKAKYELMYEWMTERINEWY